MLFARPHVPGQLSRSGPLGIWTASCITVLRLFLVIRLGLTSRAQWGNPGIQEARVLTILPSPSPGAPLTMPF